MNLETKKQVLVVFDALSKFDNLGPITQGHRFSHSHCGLCGALQGEAVNHMPDCPAEVARKAFQTLVPAFFDRDKWLSDVSEVQTTVAPQPPLP